MNKIEELDMKTFEVGYEIGLKDAMYKLNQLIEAHNYRVKAEKELQEELWPKKCDHALYVWDGIHSQQAAHCHKCGERLNENI